MEHTLQKIFLQKPGMTLEESLDAIEQSLMNIIANQTILVAETNIHENNYTKILYGEPKGPPKLERQAKEIIVPTQYHVLITKKDGRLTQELIRENIVIKLHNTKSPYYTEIITGKENALEYMKKILE